MLSLVIPLYNEEVLVERLLERVVLALNAFTEAYEVICVDDGSTDATLALLKAAHRREPRVKVLALSRNFGHQAAYTAGLSLAKGNYIAMMDGDLQDPPELLAAMYAKLTGTERDDIDIVYGKRTRRGESLQKAFSIRVFHKLFTRLSGIPDADNVGNFSMMNRTALSAFLSLEERNRYLPGLRFFIGFKQGYVEYERDERIDGEAKMNFTKLVRLGLDAIFSFSDFPIRLCFFTGMVGIVVFLLAGIYTLFAKFNGEAITGWSSTTLSIYFLGSVQLVFLGVLGEYVYRIYRETQRRPIFIVREFLE